MNKYKSYTVWISSNDKKDSVMEWNISARLLRIALISFGVLAVILCAFAIDYFIAFTSRMNAQEYQVKNQELKQQMIHAKKQLFTIQSRLQQIEDFSHQLKTMLGLKKSSSLLSMQAIGPLAKGSSLTAWYMDDFPRSENKVVPDVRPVVLQDEPVAIDALNLQMEKLDQSSQLTQENIHNLLHEIYTRKDVLSSTPSMLPVQGWISSTFGYRQYPFTGEVALHEGIDIAALPGTPVYAPATGEVIFAGYKTGYGNAIIIDHGYRLSTLYGHLSDIMVSEGQVIKRRQVIGVTGNTGHSSGPHLHYEVRIAGVPVDPSNYILDEI